MPVEYLVIFFEIMKTFSELNLHFNLFQGNFANKGSVWWVCMCLEYNFILYNFLDIDVIPECFYLILEFDYGLTIIYLPNGQTLVVVKLQSQLKI